MEWFRWYHGTTTDAKFTVIARRSGQHRTVVLAVWSSVLEYASSRKDRGSVVGLDLEEVAAGLDLDLEQVEAVCAVMREKGVISDDRLANWTKRQPKREDATAADRKERWRQRQKAGQGADIEGEEPEEERSGTQGNASGTVGTCKNRTEQSITEQRRLTSSSSSTSVVNNPPEEPSETATADADAADVKPVPLTLPEFRRIYQECIGVMMPGGLNHEAKVMCDRHPRDRLEEAFRLTAEKGGKSLAYVKTILEGEKKKADVDWSELYRD